MSLVPILDTSTAGGDDCTCRMACGSCWIQVQRVLDLCVCVPHSVVVTALAEWHADHRVPGRGADGAVAVGGKHPEAGQRPVLPPHQRRQH